MSSDGYNAVVRLIATLRAKRESLGIDQADLAERMGVAPSALYRLETFKALNPSIWTLLQWAEALGCEIGLELREKAKLR